MIFEGRDSTGKNFNRKVFALGENREENGKKIFEDLEKISIGKFSMEKFSQSARIGKKMKNDFRRVRLIWKSHSLSARIGNREFGG